MLNVFLTFLLCGLWHGAGWNYVLWGSLHGLMLAIYHWKSKVIPWLRLSPWLAVALTFILVQFTWVPFRVDGPHQIFAIWSGMLGLNRPVASLIPLTDALLLGLVASATFLVPSAARRWPGSSGWPESTALAGLATFALASNPEVTSFIYFQF